MPRYFRRSLPVLGAATLALVLPACSSPTGSTSGMEHQSGQSTAATTTTTAARPVESRAADLMFVQMMIPHHEQAVRMADIALAKRQASPEVRRIANQIKAAQEPEIQTMKGWLETWGPSATSTAMDHQGMGHGAGDGMMSQTDMESLSKAAGADFDTMWLTMMIEHHQGAITMAKQVLVTTNDDRVRALATAVVSAQAEEITTMKGLE